MNLALLGKALVIALLSGIAAWLPMALLLLWGIDTELRLSFGLRLLLFALLGSFAVGLPIALLTFHLSARELAKKPTTVFLAANLAGAILMFVTYLLGGPFGAVFYGVPSLIAANTFAALGWYMILQPTRVVQP